MRKLFSIIFIVAFLLSGFTAFATNAVANDSKYASLIIDADSGVILHQENASKHRYPASLTKMMTLYLTFQALERGKLKMNQKLRVSSRAAAQPASKLGLRRGEQITVRDAIQSVIVKSANDSAVVLSEAIGGSEWQFAIKMNNMAKTLGMNHTNFKNSSGLHNKQQKSTAYDLARLAVALKRDYRKYYHLFNSTKFFYKGRQYVSHNNVTKKYRGADGLKTGYIRAAGYNLVTSASRGGRSLVGVVLGGKSSKRRDRHMVKLLDSAFIKLAQGKTSNRVYASADAPTPKLKSNVFLAKIRPTPELKPVPVLANNKVMPVLRRNGYKDGNSVLVEGTPTPKLKPGETSISRNIFVPAKQAMF